MTQIGFVGLGKMGGNMVHRIRRDSDHEVVGYARSESSVQAAVRHGAAGAGSLRDLVRQLRPPRPATRPRKRSSSSPNCSTAAT